MLTVTCLWREKYCIILIIIILDKGIGDSSEVIYSMQIYHRHNYIIESALYVKI